MKQLTKQKISEAIEGKLSRYDGLASPKEATPEQLYKATALAVRDILLEKRKNFHQKAREQNAKRVYYLCMEFLLGRSLKNNLANLGILQQVSEVLAGYGTDLDALLELEPDAGLGNGGLGRLAACFLDALASGDYYAMGFCLRYEFGLFKQKIVDGWQMELPDNWLPGGDVWLVQRSDKMFDVSFDGWIEEQWTESGLQVFHRDARVIQAVGYDVMISGGDSEAVSVLRLWRPVSKKQFDMQSFSQGDYLRALKEDNDADLLGKVLYPADNHFEGKSLRLQQQYFLVSASIQNIIADHKRRVGSLDLLPEYAAIHINDTHPALCIPELMRILIDENGYDWDRAFDIVTRTVAYTNHTVMAEALEQWQENLIERRLPRIHAIIKEINRRFCEKMWQRFPGQWDTIERMAVLSHGLVRMANLAVIGSHSVNGVSALHSEIIRQSVFHDFYVENPGKFTNVTNGIAHRRWLCQANPRLSVLLDETIGHGYYKDASLLKRFEAFADDRGVLDRLNDIKAQNKRDFAEVLFRKQGISVNPDSIFFSQVKRLHEYKRQLLNALHIISMYCDLKENPNADFTPQTFLFAAKAAPGYYMAKQIIKLICFLAEDIRKNPIAKDRLNVVFCEDYCVTMAEKLIPASDVSEQISLAGKEASGTGNMKFMINGAVTVGTLDGANVEMLEAVGPENIQIFGLTCDEVDALWKKGYQSTFYLGDERIKRVIDALNVGFAGESFEDLSRYLLTSGTVPDPYMCLADYAAFDQIHEDTVRKYLDRRKFARMALMNIANAGRFSADRSIAEYCSGIWGAKPVR